MILPLETKGGLFGLSTQQPKTFFGGKFSLDHGSSLGPVQNNAYHHTGKTGGQNGIGPSQNGSKSAAGPLIGSMHTGELAYAIFNPNDGEKTRG